MIENQQDKIKLIKGQRGTYGWEISLYDLNVETIKELDKQMREAFKGAENE